jgi:hypothetical protein
MSAGNEQPHHFSARALEFGLKIRCGSRKRVRFMVAVAAAAVLLGSRASGVGCAGFAWRRGEFD